MRNVKPCKYITFLYSQGRIRSPQKQDFMLCPDATFFGYG